MIIEYLVSSSGMPGTLLLRQRAPYILRALNMRPGLDIEDVRRRHFNLLTDGKFSTNYLD